MDKILEFTHYISSDEMVTPNIDTEEFLSRECRGGSHF